MNLRIRIRYLAVVCSVIFAAFMAHAAEKAQPINELAFRSDSGKSVGWKDIAGEKGTVLVFLSFDCPMSTGYSKYLTDLARTYAGNGIKFVGLCPCDEDAAHVA